MEPIKCMGCGLVNVGTATACRRCARAFGQVTEPAAPLPATAPGAGVEPAPAPAPPGAMTAAVPVAPAGATAAATAPAPAGSARALLGPVFSAGGFKTWLLVCTDDAIVAVPQSLLLAVPPEVAYLGVVIPGVLAGMDGFHHLGTTAVLSGVVGAGLALLVQLAKKTTASARRALLERSDERLLADPANLAFTSRDLVSLTVHRPVASNAEVRIGTRTSTLVFGVVRPGDLAPIAAELQRRYPGIWTRPT